MHTARTIRGALIAVGCAAILTGPALAGGEPKNTLPFTHQVSTRATSQATANSTVKPEPTISGEAKNESPFTDPVPVIVQSDGGFNWLDAGLGLIVGICLAATGAGLVAFRPSKSPQTA